jgi:hypothetical protein
MESQFLKAVRWAERAHAEELRFEKGPYLYHPLEVASLVLQTGGSEQQSVVALLHDTLGKVGCTLESIGQEFGPEIARGVETFVDPEPNEADRVRASMFAKEPGQIPWFVARAAYLRKLGEVTESELHVVACEEFQEIRELVMDYERLGPSILKRYPAPAAQLFWYHRELLALFMKKLRAQALVAMTSNYAGYLRKLQEIGLPS